MLNGVQSTMRQRGDCSKCGWGNEKSGLNFYANSLTTTDEVGIKSEERERERLRHGLQRREGRDVLYREGI